MAAPTKEELVPATKRFNRWQFIEAHNLFKGLAEAADGPDKHFLGAISSIAGAFAKIWHKGGEPHAMVSQLQEGIDGLKRFIPRYMDFELEEFVAELLHCMNESKRWRRGDTEIFDRDLIPRLKFSPK